MKRSNTYIIAAFAAGIVYRLLISMQGVDGIDSGFSNTFFQNIFSHPESMTFYFNYYLTGVAGGLWYQLLPDTGMLGFRLAEVLTLAAAIALMYAACRPWLNNRLVGAAAVATSFLFPSIVTTLHYNTLSFLFMAAAVWCYAQALARPAPRLPARWLVAAGAMLGIAFFVRTVNVALSAVAFVPLLSLIGGRQQPATSLGTALRECVLLLLGMVAGSLCVLALLTATRQLACFTQALREAFGFFGSNETSHASSNLFAVYLKSYVNIGLQMLVLALVYWLYWHNCQRQTTLRLLGLPVTHVALAAVTLLLVVTSLPYLTTVAAASLLCLWVVKRRGWADAHSRLLLFAGACTLIFPFGSDIGIPGIFHWVGGLLILPAATCWDESSPTLRRATALVCTLVALTMLMRTVGRVYGESESRLSCTSVAQPCRLNTFTTAQKAADYQHSISLIDRYAADNPWLVIGNQASELYYATGRRPFLGNTQAGTYMGTTLLHRLDQRMRETRQAPVIVFLADDFHTSDESAEVQRTLTLWMHQNSYSTVYADQQIKIFSQQ